MYGNFIAIKYKNSRVQHWGTNLVFKCGYCGEESSNSILYYDTSTPSRVECIHCKKENMIDFSQLTKQQLTPA